MLEKEEPGVTTRITVVVACNMALIHGLHAIAVESKNYAQDAEGPATVAETLKVLEGGEAGEEGKMWAREGLQLMDLVMEGCRMDLGELLLTGEGPEWQHDEFAKRICQGTEDVLKRVQEGREQAMRDIRKNNEQIARREKTAEATASKQGTSGDQPVPEDESEKPKPASWDWAQCYEEPLPDPVMIHGIWWENHGMGAPEQWCGFPPAGAQAEGLGGNDPELRIGYIRCRHGRARAEVPLLLGGKVIEWVTLMEEEGCGKEWGGVAFSDEERERWMEEASIRIAHWWSQTPQETEGGTERWGGKPPGATMDPLPDPWNAVGQVQGWARDEWICLKLGIHGSRADGDAAPWSDVNVEARGVRTEGDAIRLRRELERACGRPVTLITDAVEPLGTIWIRDRKRALPEGDGTREKRGNALARRCWGQHIAALERRLHRVQSSRERGGEGKSLSRTWDRDQARKIAQAIPWEAKEQYGDVPWALIEGGEEGEDPFKDGMRWLDQALEALREAKRKSRVFWDGESPGAGGESLPPGIGVEL